MIKIISSLWLLALALPGLAFDHQHQAWTDFTSRYVVKDKFDYQAAASKQGQVAEYLNSVKAVDKASFGEWSEQERLAFLINLYNAATIDLVLKHYPIDSIREINNGEPWKLKVVDVFGKMVSLDHLEHQMIRKWFAEPRIHFAVNCASVGCPSLRNEAYVAKRLDRQLEQQTREFLLDEKHNSVQQNSVVLSSLFDWYGEDFVKQSGSLEKFIVAYLPEAKGKSIRFGDYDWSLNSTR